MITNISVEYGDSTTGVCIIDDYILSATVVQETRKISTELPASVLDLELETTDIVFLPKKPICIYQNGELVQKTFITNAKKLDKKRWNISAIDYIGILDYFECSERFFYRQDLKSVLTELFSGTNILFELSEEAEDIVVSGTVSSGTLRSALQELCFSFGLVATTAHSEKIVIHIVNDVISQTVGLDRIMAGITVDEKDSLTKLSLSYSVISTSSTEEYIYETYRNDFLINNKGKWIEFEYPQPSLFTGFTSNNYYSVDVPNKEYKLFSTFDASSHYRLRAKIVDDYAVSPPMQGFVRFGIKAYETQPGDVLTKEIENDGDFQITNEKQISSVGTMTSENAQKAIDRIFDNLSVGKIIKAKIIEGRIYDKYGSFLFGEKPFNSFEYDQPINVGENVEVETSEGNYEIGFVEKVTYKLYGSTKIVKETVIT